MNTHPSRASLLLVATVALVGCATGASKDFWSGLSVIKSDQTFHHGRYIGSESGCFPPITNRECIPLKRAEVLYSADRQLELESFNFSLASDFFGMQQAKEKLYFAAAELGLSRGFRMFTVITTFESTTCREGVNASTSGVLTPNPSGQGGSYSGSTTVRPDGQCLISQGIRVIYFNNKEDLAPGVLARNTTGTSQLLHPVSSLYYGSIPNLRDQDFNYQPLPGSFTRTPENAWKVHFDAAGLSKDFRKKFAVPSPPIISFRDEARENTERDAKDPLKRNRVTSP